jgi:hypothetical protein
MQLVRLFISQHLEVSGIDLKRTSVHKEYIVAMIIEHSIYTHVYLVLARVIEKCLINTNTTEQFHFNF